MIQMLMSASVNQDHLETVTLNVMSSKLLVAPTAQSMHIVLKIRLAVPINVNVTQDIMEMDIYVSR